MGTRGVKGHTNVGNGSGMQMLLKSGSDNVFSENVQTEGADVRKEEDTDVVKTSEVRTIPESKFPGDALRVPSTSNELKLTQQNVCKLARMLLWDTLGEKYQLTETANQINRAVATMVTAHGSKWKPANQMRANNSDNILEEEEADSEAMPITPQKSFKERRYSGEYLPMKCSPSRRLSLEIPKPKPHEEIPMSPLVFEKTMIQRMESCAADYTQMFPETHECSELCCHYPPTPRIDQICGDDDNDEEELRKNPPKFGLFDQDSESEVSPAKEVNTSGDVNQMLELEKSETTSSEMPETIEDKISGPATEERRTSAERRSVDIAPKAAKRTLGRPGSVIMYEGMLEEWYGLPADVKYKQDYVTLLVLMEEQSRVVGKLHEKQQLQVGFHRVLLLNFLVSFLW